MSSISVILLGEGDFTYSLDVCRFMAASLATSAFNLKSALDGLDSISITCTGIDTLHELSEKYKDIEFVLRNIRKCNNARIKTQILHGINAVEAECTVIDDRNNNSVCQSFDHVIFNHPHLGTEDAHLHSRFLQHLFHACSKRWMQPRTGLLHLTLVNGQCARWKCIEGAKQHGLELLRRGTFYPPNFLPTTNSDRECTTQVRSTYYNLRRHQSGRSFANRRRDNGSETLIFGRACDEYQVADSIRLLPWENMYCDTANHVPILKATTTELSNNHTNLFSCKYCSKSFPEHRSLKNHLVSLHPTSEDVRTLNIEKSGKRKKRRKLSNEGINNGENNVLGVKNTGKRQSDGKTVPCDGIDDGIQGPPWICSICNSQQLTLQRIFPHKEALLAHQRAKHFGLHLDIKPDWQVRQSNVNDEKDSSNAGDNKDSPRSCPICHKHFINEYEESLHAMEFLPTLSVLATATAQKFASGNRLRSEISSSGNVCTYCSKILKGVRARLQHENFCSRRPQEGT